MTPRRAQSDAERIKIFLSLANQFLELCDEFPEPAEGLVLGSTETQRKPSDHWHRVLRLASIRKFVITKNENVYIPTVLDSCIALIPREQAAYAEHGKTLLRDLQARSILNVNFGIAERTIPELVEDYLNGVVLHSDAEKWHRHQVEKSAIEVVLYFWINEMERYVRQAYLTVRTWVDEGHLQLGE